MIPRPHCELDPDCLGQLHGFQGVDVLTSNILIFLFLKIGRKKFLKHERCNLGFQNLSTDVLNTELGHENSY